MKIAFYLPNKNCQADCTQIDKGNPGIGGTEYEIIAIVYYLTLYYKSNYYFTLIAQNTKGLPTSINCLQAQNLRESITICEGNDYDLLIVVATKEAEVTLNNYSGKKLKIIIWGHSFLTRKSLNTFAQLRNIVRIVCVGNEEAELFIDNQAYKKTNVIFNAFPLTYNKSLYVPFDMRKNEVTFLASIVPHTNFHILAKAWKSVIEKIPDAHLNVIGSGNLYNNNAKLGKWGIAEESYEKLFMPYLLDDNENILPSVTFHGKLGIEKYEILGKTKVGVPNPGGYETFCISALEMQLYGSRISTIKSGGFIDTVYDLDNLYSKVEQLADNIIMHLKSTDNNHSEFMLFAENRFSFKKITNDWITLFSDIKANKYIPINYKPINHDLLHSIRRANRVLKNFMWGGKYLPTTMYYQTIFNYIKKKIICHH